MPLPKALGNTSILEIMSSSFDLTSDALAKLVAALGKRVFNLPLMTDFSSSFKITFVSAAATAAAAESSDLSRN